MYLNSYMESVCVNMWNILITFYSVLSILRVYCSLEVNTTSGTIKGRIWISQKGREFLGFTGIPYAEPPVGKLRFQAPNRTKSWKGVLDATKTHSPCPQVEYFAKNFTIVGKEDCLYLNVYKPLEGKYHPVMFYIHGGSFNIGSGADDWIGPEILLDSDVVLVIINYRLGALGFLSTEDEIQPGNNGLKDQAIALQWVKDNIEYFGGDASSLTAFGNSAGAMSVQYLTMSPLTKDLLSGAIIQSGSAITVFPPVSKGVAKAHAEKLGLLSKCPINSTLELVNCLNEIDVNDLIRNEYSVADSKESLISPFQPVTEVHHTGAFISEDPVAIIKNRKFANIPIVIGTVSQEGAYRSAEISVQPGQLQKLNDDFGKMISNSFSIAENVVKTTKSIRQYYFGNKTIDNSTKAEITNLFSDGWFLSSFDLTLHILLDHKFPGQPIYVYLFDYVGSNSYSKLYGDLSFDYGVCHTDELLYLISRHHIFPKYELTAEDLKMAEVLSKLWVDFAKMGKPTPYSNVWQPLSTKELEYLHIQSPNILNMEEGFYSNRRKFWRENVYQSVWKKYY